MDSPPPRREPSPSRSREWIGWVLVVPLGLGLLLFLWMWYAPCALGGCAPVADLSQFQAEGSELLDVNGEAFATLATVNRRVIPLDSMPDHLTQAFLAVEDRQFYRHDGVDARRMLGAVASNLQRGGVAEGGSTLTMQLARNLFPEQLPFAEQTLRRKIMEIRVARQIERTFPKDKIFELYLNHIYLGSGAYGVEAAAQTYFGRSAPDLDLPQAALIAGLPQAPSNINPRRDIDRSRERRNLVLRRMESAGVITAAERDEASEASIELAEEAGVGEEGVRAGYFRERVRRALEDEIGSQFYTAGLRIHTTLDLSAQQAAEEELENQISAIEAGRFGAYRHPVFSRGVVDEDEDRTTDYLQGVAVVLEAETGAVRALVGGRDFDDSKFDRAVQALRQPGSAFKPFVYLAALQRRTPPIHRIEDERIQLTLSGGRTWSPRNFGGSYDGPMTIREALTRSKNTVTVQLAQDVGMGSVVRVARELGITNEISETPATALGSAEVRPIDLIASYAAFANGGQRVEPHFIDRVEDRNGRVLWQSSHSSQRAIDAGEAFVLTSMLRDVVDRGTGTAVRGAGFNAPAAGKTGTTNDATDVWFIGYTPDLVGGVWMGLDRPATIVSGATGGTLAAPVWGRIMNRIYQNRATPSEWTPPSSVSSAEADRVTGQLVSDLCPSTGQSYTEYFVGSPPSPGPCPDDPWGDRRFAEDGIWGDEEFGFDDDGVEWPELEERRRGEDWWEEMDTFPEDTLPEEEVEPLPDPDTLPEPDPLPEPEPLPEDTMPDPEPPDVLGEPVDGDDGSRV